MLREIMFRRPLTLSVLTERRVYQPYGMNGIVCEMCWCECVCVCVCVGGAPGAKGKNLLIRANGEMIDLGGKECAAVQPWVSHS